MTHPPAKHALKICIRALLSGNLRFFWHFNNNRTWERPVIYISCTDSLYNKFSLLILSLRFDIGWFKGSRAENRQGRKYLTATKTHLSSGPSSNCVYIFRIYWNFLLYGLCEIEFGLVRRERQGCAKGADRRIYIYSFLGAKWWNRALKDSLELQEHIHRTVKLRYV